MPFKSEKQRAYLAANEPQVFEEWKQKYGLEIKPKNNNKDKKK